MAATQQLLKSLEERAKEIEGLKKDLQNCQKESEFRNLLESQKQTFDAKQSPDLQNLLLQKRELQTQLEREESEKHELFFQINHLIGEIATLRSNDEANALQNQITQLNAENDVLKKDFGRKEASFQLLTNEFTAFRSDCERREQLQQLEKKRLQDEILDCQKEIELKSAALQSLKLARHKTDDTKQLLIENEALQKAVQEKEDLLRELTESNDELGRSLSESGSQIEALRTQLSTEETNLLKSVNELQNLKEKFNSNEVERKQALNDIEILKAELSDAKKTCETFKIQFKNSLEKEEKKNFSADTELREDLSKIMDALRESKTDLRAKDAEITELRKRVNEQNEDLDDAAAQLKKAKNFYKLANNSSCENCKLNEFEWKETKFELVSLKKQTEELKNDLLVESSKNNKLLSLEPDLVSVKAERDNLRIELNDKNLRLTKVEAILQKLELSLQLAINDSEVSADAAIKKLKLKNDDFSAEISQLRQSMEKQRLTADSTLQKLNQTETLLQKVEAKNLKLVNEICESLEISKSYDNDDFVEIIFGELKNLKNFKSDSRKLIADLHQQLNDSNEEVLKTKRKLANLQSTRNDQVEEVQSKLLKHELDFSNKLNAETTKKLALECENKEFKIQLENLKEKNLNAQFEIQSLRDKLLDLDQMSAEKLLLQSQIENLNNNLALKNVEISNLQNVSAEEKTSLLNNKVSELLEENAKLAGDLLKQETVAEQRFKLAFSAEQKNWQVEKRQLEAQLSKTCTEFDRLLANQESKETNLSEAVPKPFPRNNRIVEKVDSSNAKNLEVEVERLQTELDKQKRLVTVLRKKLQAEILESTR